MPAYNCGTEVDPFVSYGLDVILYRVDRNARMDSEDLFKRVTEKTKVIYVIHYFGWPQDMRSLSEYCIKNHIYLIEDCALSLFSTSFEHPIGVLGDAAIYSFPKTLPVPEGGGLTISKEDAMAEFSPESPPAGVIVKEMLPLIKRSVLRFGDRVGVYRYLPNRLIQSRHSNTPSTTSAGLPEIPQSYYYDRNIQNMTASAMTRFLLKHACPESVVQQRRANYTQLYDAIKDLSPFKPLYSELLEGVCPLYFPVLVENRKAVCTQLNSKGISAIQWWAGFHRAFGWAEFPEARYLKEHLLALPIHQQLTELHINYMAQQMAQVAAVL